LQDVTTADMIALVKTERDGVMYYEWDLAISPKVCAQEQLLIQGLCFPDTVRTLPIPSLTSRRRRRCVIRLSAEC